MKYRVVKRGELYQAQYRMWFFWWIDSGHFPCSKEEAIHFAEMADTTKNVIVWP